MGIRISIFSESISNPKKQMTVAGPAVFSYDKGTFKCFMHC